MTANEFTMASYNSILQEERDLVSYAFKTAENQAEREIRVQLAALEAELSRARTQAELDASRGSGFGKIVASIAPTIIKYGLDKLG
jgi:biopolymer transport protein ExbB/TolQ